VVAAQRDRWLLWLPFAAIAGAAVWLAAPADPPPTLAPVSCAILLTLALIFAAWPGERRGAALTMIRTALSGVCAFFAAFALGATAAEVRVALVAAPRIAAEIGPVAVEGWVEEIEAGAPRTRMLVRVRAIEGLQEGPRFVRITQPGTRAFTAGRAVRCRAMLRAPDGPLAPGAYDFARRAYFERIGATGFTRGSCRPIALARWWATGASSRSP
jgi:competence protein ComEC